MILHALSLFLVVAMALGLSLSSAVDVVMLTLRVNYGFNVGQVRGPMFVVGLIIEFSLATVLWIIAIVVVSQTEEFSTPAPREEVDTAK